MFYDGETVVTIPPEIHKIKVDVPGERPLAIERENIIATTALQAGHKANAQTLWIWTSTGVVVAATIAWVIAPDPSDPIVAALVAAKGIRFFIREGKEILGIGVKGERILLAEAEQAAAAKATRAAALIEDKTKHMFRIAPGHLPDTPQNRALLTELANDTTSYIGKDARGQVWHARLTPEGKQIWVEVRDGTIRNGGINDVPRPFTPETGLKQSLPPRDPPSAPCGTSP